MSIQSHKKSKTNDNRKKTDTINMLRKAASLNHPHAALALAHRHQRGLNNLPKDHEAIAHYLRIASSHADEYYHKPGNQPYHEQHRLRVGHERDIQRGQTGDDDEELQFTIMMAEKGDVESMNSLANFLYWGARGFQRDHERALELWEAVAAHDHIGGLCGAASMYVRGEGTEIHMEKAVELYERAAKQGSPTALNGLGYAYFLVQGGLPQPACVIFVSFQKTVSSKKNRVASFRRRVL